MHLWLDIQTFEDNESCRNLFVQTRTYDLFQCFMPVKIGGLKLLFSASYLL